MKLGNWEIYLGSLYHNLPDDWEDLDEAFKRSRPVWSVIGVYLWHEPTDEGHMLEIRFNRKGDTLRMKPEYTHIPGDNEVTTLDQLGLPVDPVSKEIKPLPLYLL